MSSPAQSMMRFASAVTNEDRPAAAATQIAQQVHEQLGSTKPHVAFLFTSSVYGEVDWQPIVQSVRRALGGPVLLGCSGGGVIGPDHEWEFSPGMSLAAASLPGVELHPVTVTQDELEDSLDPPYWIEKIGVHPDQEPMGILLPDPQTCDAVALLSVLHTAYPSMPLIGGLASHRQQDDRALLLLNDTVITSGAIGLVLTGNVVVQTIVAQGCRPIGRPYIITKAENNVILELASVPAVQALQQLYQTLSHEDQALSRQALFLGIVMNEQQTEFEQGDFLIRNLMGIDPSTGALAIGDHVRVGQTVQFQLRDAQTSRDDLAFLLREHAKQRASDPPAGALLFSCVGRGQDLYGEPHYDVRAIQSAVGPVPLAGFFCNGEIGPVGKHNFIHGFTSSLGLFRPRNPRTLS